MASEQDPSTMMSRRNFLVATGVLAGGLLLDACGGSGISKAVTDRLPGERTEEVRFSARPSWEQDFSGMPDGSPDPRFWNIDTGNTIPGYNDEAQTLTARPENVRIEDRLLVIEAHKEPLNGREYTSGHINTQGKFSFQYGRLEVDLRVPAGVGTWPAAWLLSEGAKYKPQKYGLPASDSPWPLNGEIDFFEAVGAEPGRVYPDVHTYDSVKAGQNGTRHLTLPHDTEQFNTFGAEMSPGKIAFSHNGKVYHSVEKTSDDPKEWPFDQPYYLILNLAMGGTWGGEDKQKFPPDGIQGDGPWQMAVKAVRFHKLVS